MLNWKLMAATHCAIVHVSNVEYVAYLEGASLEFKQTVVLKFEKGEHSQWTSDSALLYHLEALTSLWMYSFLYEEEPKIDYYQTGPNIATWLDFLLKNRLLDDYFVIIGTEDAKSRLTSLDVEKQNIVEIVGKETPVATKAMIRDCIPIFADLDSEEAEKERPKSHKKGHEANDTPKRTPDFVRRENLFGRCLPSWDDQTLYAYKYSSSPGVPKSRRN
jgi:hypothetical protein